MTESTATEPFTSTRKDERGSSTTSAAIDLTVTTIDGIAVLERMAAEIDQLNLISTRPNAFLSAAFLHCYALRIEYYTPGKEERLFLVREGTRLIGCAPMRRSIERFGPALGPFSLRSIRLNFLASLDTDQPGLICAPEDEERVAIALMHYICEHERDWDMVEFAGQRRDTALHRAVHAATSSRFRARDIEVEPYNEITLTWPDLMNYFRSLVKKMRSNISRQARRLYAAGEIELVLAEGSPATSAWFDAYCDLDKRSWKHDTESSIQRHPRRVRFYREIVAGRGGMEPSFVGVLLDGVLVAGLIVGSNTGVSPNQQGAWCLEMAYDKSLADLGPGQLLLLIAVGEAIHRGDRFLNFLQMFAYYKHRWKAEPIDVVNVQLLRRFSLLDARGLAGELKRKWIANKQPSTVQNEPATDEAAESYQGTHAPDTAEWQRARKIAAAANVYTGPKIRRLNRDQARLYLPFPLE
jgi:Acetyltransferase (GNAT) domain